MFLLPAGRRRGDNFRKEHAATVLGGSRCHSYLPAAQRWLKDQMDFVTAWLCVAILVLQGWLHGQEAAQGIVLICELHPVKEAEIAFKQSMLPLSRKTS